MNNRVSRGVVMVVEDAMQTAKWVSCRGEFDGIKVDGVLSNWEASLFCGAPKVRKVVSWALPISGV